MGMLTLIVLVLVLAAPLTLSSDVPPTNLQAAIIVGTSDLSYPAGGLAFDPSGNLWVVQVSGNSMTLTLTNASQEGVISMVSGPALSSITSSPISSTNSAVPPQNTSPSNLTSLPVAILIVAIIIIIAVVVAARKRAKRAST